MEWDNKRRDDPSPEEIKLMCAQIRSGWDEARWRRETSKSSIMANLITISRICAPVNRRRISDD